MAERPGRNWINDLLSTVGEAFAEVTKGALTDIRHRWEEAWFGDQPMGFDPPDEPLFDQTGWSELHLEVDTTFELVCERCAHLREHRDGPDRSPEIDHEIDR
jgi:hypothetical protein